MQEEEIPPDVCCAVCLSILVDPCSLACGHSFCAICLEGILAHAPPRCPSCRARAQKTAANIQLRALVQQLYPDQERARRQELEAEGVGVRSDDAVLQLFPQNAAVLQNRDLEFQRLNHDRRRLDLERQVCELKAHLLDIEERALASPGQADALRGEYLAIREQHMLFLRRTKEMLEPARALLGRNLDLHAALPVGYQRLFLL